MTGLLVVLACLTADPSTCGKVSMIVEGCSAGGQASAAQWVAEHPEYFIRAWLSCEPGQPA
jgi:hypothetical protein